MTASTIAPITVARDLGFADLRRALGAGFRDFLSAPQFGLFFAAFYVVGGWIALLSLSHRGEGWWIIPVAAAFPLFAPFSAVGLYEVSRRREAGERLSWGAVLGAAIGRGELFMMGVLVFIAVAVWIGLAHGVYAIFLGESGMGTSAGFRLTLEAAAMLLVGGLLGGLFALALFAVTVISLPLLVDRDVDFITAIITSLGVVGANKGVMIGWALIVAVALALAMIPAFLGLFLVLPWLGHATWHLYRRSCRVEEGDLQSRSAPST